MPSTHYATQSLDAIGVETSLRWNLRSLALDFLSMVNRKIDERFLRCIYCHFVFDDQKEMFERVLVEVQKIGAFVDSDTCIRMLEGRQPIDGRYFHLSFDDGFRNHYLNALPILKKLKIPAIFFVPSGFISSGYEQVSHYCVDIAKYKMPIELLQWEDLKQMISAGYQIGSHTRTHARFSDISSDPAKMDEEIRGSKLELEDHLGYECKYISWPFGTGTDTDATALNFVGESKYTACFSACRGTVIPEKTDRLRIPRHHFEANWKVPHVRSFSSGNMEENQ